MGSTMVTVAADPEELAATAASMCAEILSGAISARGTATVLLAGGSTPRSTYRRLARDFGRSVPWPQVHLFWGDERMVPADHPDSNQQMVREALLSGLDLSADQIHPIETEDRSAVAAAADYDRTLRQSFGLQGTEQPSFDLVLLGLGNDGHTASLLPGCPALNETHARVAVCTSPHASHTRITVTLPVLNAGREVLFLVSGPSKAIALRRVVEDKDGSLPAARVCPTAGRLQFLVDADAAAELATGGSP